MALLWLSRRFCVFLVFFLIVNPLSVLLAREDTKPPPGNKGKYRGTDRGCKAVLNSIFQDFNFNPGDLKLAFSSIKVDPTDKELQSVFNRIVEFVRANPDKVSGAASVAALAASACLLYDSIILTHRIRLFVDKFKELQGRFNAFINARLPSIEKLLIEIRQKIETGSAPDDKQYQRIEFVLLMYFKEVSDVLDEVSDLIEEAVVAEWDAKFTAAVSFSFAIATGIAASPVVPIGGLVFKGGMVGASCLAATAGVWSLRNANDCKQALLEMQVFKKEVQDLKSQAWDWVMEVKMH